MPNVTLKKKSINLTIIPSTGHGVHHSMTADKNFILHYDNNYQLSPDHTLMEKNRSGSNANNLTNNSNIIIHPGEAAVIATVAQQQTSPGAQWYRPEYMSAPGRSSIAEMLAVVCVDWPPQSSAVFRPPAIGTSGVANFLRQAPIFESQMRLDLLPSVIDLSLMPSVEPISVYERLFSDFSGEIYDGWSTDTRTPDLQHPGYGTYLAAAVSEALIHLCSNAPVESKRKLARSMVQWGIDLAGAFSDGRNNSSPGGGHMLGRKALLILAGYLLEQDTMRNPSAYIGSMFAEDVVFAPPNGWRHSFNAESAAGPWSEMRIWSSQTQTEMSYIDQVTGCQIGTYVAMLLMGLTNEMGSNFSNWCQRWMRMEESDEVVQAYTLNEMSPAWRTAYSVTGGADMCERAWLQLYGV